VQENGVAGDLVMGLRQKKHGKFTRKGDDLVYEHELSLAEALCGFQFVITHLDGRRLLVTSGAGEVIRPGQLKAIDGEGMPVHGMPFAKGTLYVAFRVAFPGTMTPALRDAVAAAFPPAPKAAAVEDGGGWRGDDDDDAGRRRGRGDEAQREGRAVADDADGARRRRRG
jgi:DnaJ family protein A protein 2